MAAPAKGPSQYTQVLPDAADHGRAEGHGGVHGCAVERAAGQDVGTYDEADGDGRDHPEVAALGVDRRGVHRVDEPEGHDDLEHHRVPDADTGREREGAHGLAAGGDLEEEAGHDGAEQLRHPVHDGLEQADVAADEGAECDGRVHVPARDVGTHRDGHEEGESVRQRRRYEPGRRRRAAVSQLAESHAGAGAGEDEDEHGDELGDAGAEGVRVGQLPRGADGDPAHRHFRRALFFSGWMVSGWDSSCAV